MARWLTDEQEAKLRAQGRLKESTSVGTRESRADEKKRLAQEWNGNVDTSELSNVEFVTVTSGGVESRHARELAQSGERRQWPEEAGLATSPRGRDVGAGVAPGPLTLYPLVGICRGAGLPEPLPEYEFAKILGRKWRADYCWPTSRLILEIEGGLWTNGRHSRGKGAIADLEKYSEAAILGYRVIYATPDEVRNGTALDRVQRALSPMKSAA